MDDSYRIFVTSDRSRAKKDERQRYIYYVDWLTATNRHWYEPDLNAYRDYLLNERYLKPSSAAAHLGTIRTRYKNLLEDSQTLQELLHQVIPDLDGQSTAIAAIQAATKPDAGRVEFDRNFQVTYLSVQRMDALLTQPDLSTLQGLRDVTAIGMMYCTGLTETELCALQVADLYWEKEGQTAIHVPETSVGPKRLVIVYDDILFNAAWLLQYIQAMLEGNGTTEGPIFLGYFRGGNVLNRASLTPRGMQKMLKEYPLEDANGNAITVTALTIRRAFARNLFKLGVSFDAIHANLGHLRQRTTFEYIGLPDAEQNVPIGNAKPLLQRLYDSGHFSR